MCPCERVLRGIAILLGLFAQCCIFQKNVNLFPCDFDNITKDSHFDDMAFSFSCALFSVFLHRGERIRTTVWEPERKSMRGEHEGQRAARSREA